MYPKDLEVTLHYKRSRPNSRLQSLASLCQSRASSSKRGFALPSCRSTLHTTICMSRETCRIRGTTAQLQLSLNTLVEIIYTKLDATPSSSMKLHVNQDFKEVLEEVLLHLVQPYRCKLVEGKPQLPQTSPKDLAKDYRLNGIARSSSTISTCHLPRRFTCSSLFPVCPSLSMFSPKIFGNRQRRKVR
jgi:hypothetical protein